LNHSIVGNVVRDDFLLLHSLVELDCEVDPLRVDAGLYHAGVDKDSRLDPFLFHLVKDSKRLLKLTNFLVDFSENGVRHVAGLNLQLLHVLVALKSHLGLVGLQAAVKK